MAMQADSPTDGADSPLRKVRAGNTCIPPKQPASPCQTRTSPCPPASPTKDQGRVYAMPGLALSESRWRVLRGCLVPGHIAKSKCG